MNKREIIKYLFPTFRIKYIRHRYFKQLKNLIGVNNFLGYKDTSDDDRVTIQENYAIKIEEYIREQKKNRLFIRAYHCIYLKEVAEVLLHSIVIDEFLKGINSLDDIYHDKNNVLYFDNEYPSLMTDNGTIIDYCKKHEKMITGIKLYFLREEMEGKIPNYLENKTIEKEQYNRENLEKMSIFALRYHARMVGVTYYASKSKNELIEEILRIVEGKSEN